MSRRLLVIATATSLLAAAFVGMQAPAGHADSGSTAPTSLSSGSSISDAASASDDSTASAIATTYDHTVTVTDDTTPNDLVTANPDGTMTLDASALPVRVDQGGTWIPTDLTLHASDGWVTPAATAAPVRFSSGGTSTMAQVQTDGGDWISESWPGGNLPAPQLTRDTATYASVLPGVDLRLTATATGMAEVLVINTAAAAANPDVANLELEMPNATVSVDAQQTTVATATDSSNVTSAPPTWWDSSQAGANATGPGGAGEPQPLPHTTDGDSVNLNVGAVANQAPIYPIYVDPDWDSTQNSYWFTDKAYPNQSYLNGNQSAGYQSVGWANQGGITYLSRAFWQFPISALEGKNIKGATFSDSIDYSCAATPLNLSWYGPGTPGFTWNNDPGLYHSTVDSQTPTSVGGCQISPTRITFNALAAVSLFAGESKSSIQLSVRAADESGDVTSRKHLGQTATLEVSYVSTPKVPTGMIITGPSRACGTSQSAAAWVNDGVQALKFQVNQSSADPGNLTTVFELSNDSSLGTSALGAIKASGSAQGPVTGTIDQGKLATGDFAIRAKTETTDGSESSDYSGWCYFHVQNVAPAEPQISITSPSNLTVGQNTTITVTDSDTSSVGTFAVWAANGLGVQADPASPVNGVSPTTPLHTCNPAATGWASGASWGEYICNTSGTGTATYTVTATTTAVYAAAIDRAGNASPGVGTPVSSNADSVSLTAGHSWVGDGTSATSIADLAAPSSTGSLAPTALNVGTAAAVTTTAPSGPRPYLSSGPSPSTDLYFTGGTTSATPATTAGPVIDQTKSFSVSAWLNPSVTNGTQTMTAVAETGSNGNAFSLQEAGSNWQFCLKAQNSSTPQCVSTPNNSADAYGWTFVTGVWDVSGQTAGQATGQMSIVLNGNVGDPTTNLASRAPVAGDSATTGPLVVGASTAGDATPWLGDIVGVSIYAGVPDSLQLRAIMGYGDVSQ